jgi:hypothetical protein
MIEEIRRRVHQAAQDSQKIAMFHYQVLINADNLRDMDAIEFCQAIDVPETYATEFRKMLSLAIVMGNNGSTIVAR